MTTQTADLTTLAGRRAIVTGATNGLGRATAAALAAAGVSVVLAVRDTELGKRRADEFGGDTRVRRLDLADLSSVRAFADSLDGDVDYLINNAGVFAHRRASTADGFELAMGTNFLGPFALTNLLLPRIRRQVIAVASDAHRGAADFDPDRLRSTDRRVHPARGYAESKMAVMLWGLELDRRLRAASAATTAMLTMPGWVASNISDKPGLSVVHRLVHGAATAFGNDADTAAQTTLYCLTEPVPPGSYIGVAGRGGLRGAPVLSGRSRTAGDYRLAGRLWELAEDLTQTTWQPPATSSSR